MKISQLASQLKPYAASWFQEWANNSHIRAGSSVAGGTGGGSGPHYLWDETVHVGDLLEVQAPWAATKNELAVHAAQPDVHHARATGGYGITVDGSQTVAVNIHATDPGLEVLSNAVRVGLGAGIYANSDIISLGTPSSLSSTTTNATTLVARNSSANSHTHAVVAYSDAVAQPGELLKSTSNGDITIRWLTANKILASTWLYFETGVGIQYQNTNLLRSVSFDSSFPIQGWQINEVPGVSGKSALTIGAIQADELYVRIFVANEVRVDRGELYLAKSFGITTADFVTPNAIGGTVRVYFEDSPALNGAIFTANDWVMFNLYDDSGGGLTISQIWGQVTDYIDEDPGRLHEQSWLFTLRNGRTAWTVKKGSFCVGWGQSGQGIIKMSTIDLAGNPYIKLTRWAGANPYTPANHTTMVHIGKLSAAGGSPIGTYGMMLYGATGQSVEVSESGIYMRNAVFQSFNGVNQTVNITATGDVKLGSNIAAVPNTTFEFTASTGALRIGPGSGAPSLAWSGSTLSLRNSASVDVIQLDSGGNSLFTGIMRIGAVGEIRQGTVTSGNVGGAWPLTGYTGLRIWNDTNVGRIAGYSNNLIQWSATTTGELRAGGELVSLSSTGLGLGRYTNLVTGVVISTVDQQRAISWWDDINARTGAPIARVYGGRTSDNEPVIVMDVDPGNATPGYRASIWMRGRGVLPTQLWFNNFDDIIGIPGFFATYSQTTLLSTVYLQPTDKLYIRRTMERYGGDATIDIGTMALPFHKLYVDEIIASTITGGTQITGSIWQYDSGDMYIRSLSSGQRTLYILNPGVGSMNLDVEGSILVGGTVDGVDISSFSSAYTAHAANSDAHHARAHVIATTSGLSADHTISGGVAGYTLRVTGATTAVLAQLQHTDLGGVLPDQHHAQAHAFDSADHTGTLSWVKVNKTGASLADIPSRLYGDLQSRTHVLATNTALGADHSISGASVGYTLRATGATTAVMAQLQHTDLGGVLPDQHHAKVHNIVGSDHTITGAVYQVVGVPVTTNVLGLLTPSAAPGANTLAMTDATARLSLSNLTVNNIILANGGVDYGANTLLEDATYLQLGGTKPLNSAVALQAAGWSLATWGEFIGQSVYVSYKVTTPLLGATSSLTINPDSDLLITPGSAAARVTEGVFLQTSNYASQTTGWNIGYSGGADFRYIYTDELHAKAFIADLEQALAGGQIISKSVTTLADTFVVPAAVTGTPTFRALASNGTTGLSISVSKPVGTIQWDVMVAVVSYPKARTITAAPADWTLLTTQVGGTTNNSLAIYYRVAGATEGATYSWSFNLSAEVYITIATYYNVHVLAPISIYASQTNAQSINVVAPSITTTVANSMVLFAANHSGATNTATPPATFTERVDQAGTANWIYLADRLAPLAGATGTATAVLTTSRANNAIQIALQPITNVASLLVRDLPSAPGMAVFQANDVIRLRSFSRSGGGLTIADCWGVVSGYIDNGDRTQGWTFTRSAAPNSGIMDPGTTIAPDAIVLDYGQSGNGFAETNAIDGVYAENSPYTQIVTWSGHPATGQSVRVRTGNLVGVTSTLGEYGLWAGNKAGGVLAVTDSYLRVSNLGVLLNNVPLKIYNNLGVQTVNFDVNGTNVWIGSAQQLYWNGTTLAVTGQITATTGVIGGWSIGATALTAGAGVTAVGLDSGGANPAFYAGSATPGSAPFRVANTGALYASSAVLSGTFSAASGIINIDSYGMRINANIVGVAADQNSLRFVDPANPGEGLYLGKYVTLMNSTNLTSAITAFHTSKIVRNQFLAYTDSGTANIDIVAQRNNSLSSASIALATTSGSPFTTYIDLNATTLRVNGYALASNGNSSTLNLVSSSLRTTGASNAIWVDSRDGATQFGIYNAGNYLRFWTVAGDRMILDHNGNVTLAGGILVAGSATFNGGGIYSAAGSMAFLNNSGAALQVRVGGVLVSNNYDHASRVPANGIYSLGPVHIGSYGTSYAFDVGGEMRVTGSVRSDVALSLKPQASPPTPSGTYGILYVNSSNQLYYIKQNGTAPGYYVAG